MREFKRKRGYITIVQQSGTIDYLRMAYALALSLRATQSEVPYLTIAVLPGTKIPEEYVNAFDEIVEIPWGDDAELEEWKIQNKWKVYHITPYEETVLLDADMLFTVDVSHWWKIMASFNMISTVQPRTYTGSLLDNFNNRVMFKINSLPQVYSAFMYFKQHEAVHNVFDYARRLVYYWSGIREYYQYRQMSKEDLAAYASNDRFRYGWTHDYKAFPQKISGDLMFAMAMKATGYKSPDMKLPTFVHMKTIHKDWTTVIPWTLKDDLTLTVGNYTQQYPLHYVVKDFLTNDIIQKLERA